MAPLPGFTRTALLALLAAPEPERALASPRFFGRGTHEASAVFQDGVFRLYLLEPDHEAIAAMIAAARASGREGLYPGEANPLRKLSRILVEATTASGFAAQIAAMGVAPDAPPWPWG